MGAAAALTGRGEIQGEAVRLLHPSRRRSALSASVKSTHAAAFTEIPARLAYASTCRFSVGGTRRFSDSLGSSGTTTMLPHCDLGGR